MKILKKGQRFVAYRDEKDVNNAMLNERILIGDALGSISIDTVCFVGNTACYSALKKHLYEYLKSTDYISPKQRLIDKCLERIKEDVYSGDVTAIDELLSFVPEKYLKGYL